MESPDGDNMNFQKVSFSIKNTNWCNLKCAHCCECSGSNVAPNIMPLNTVEHLVSQFNKLPCVKWGYMVLTGGEAMAPYFLNMPQYIPTCLDIFARYDMIPVVKTNVTWAADDKLRQRVLGDFASAAYKHQRLMTIEMSLDEFHNNADNVANVVRDVATSDYLSPAVRLSVVGLNTPKRQMVFAEFLMQLCNRGLLVGAGADDTLLIEIPGKRIFPIYCDANAKIANVGRAKKNNLGVYSPDGRPDGTGHCLMVDNNGVATLNNVHKMSMVNRDFQSVVRELMAKVK
ncbi:MAG: hypothetical protein IKW57_00435 [Alphaproteobacteria bacterium]|nr:hypothetical protein [Alphaproteobacteria bacterium]